MHENNGNFLRFPNFSQKLHLLLFQDWSFAHEHEKCIYLRLLEWLGKDSIKINKDDLDINVDDLCKSR